MEAVTLASIHGQEIKKLARAICDESDAAAIELNFMHPEDAVPFDSMDDAGKAVYEGMARRIYQRLVFHTGGGYIAVLDKKG